MWAGCWEQQLNKSAGWPGLAGLAAASGTCLARGARQRLQLAGMFAVYADHP